MQGYLDMAEEAKERAAAVKGKSPILFVGCTKSGKSTTINMLSGCEMHHHQNDVGDIVFKTTSEIKVDEGQEVTSETLYPQPVDHDGLTLCDLPGFGENRGENDDLCVMFGIRQVIEQAKNIKGVVIVIDWGTITEAGLNKFMKALTPDMIRFLKYPSTFSSSEKAGVVFIITKVPTDRNKSNVLAAIKSLVEGAKKLSDAKAALDASETHAFAELMTSQNTFVIYVNGNGIRLNQEGEGLLSQEANRQAILTHLKAVPDNALSKKCFMSATTANPKVAQWAVKAEIAKLASESVQTVTADAVSENLFIPLQTEIQNLAQTYTGGELHSIDIVRSYINTLNNSEPTFAEISIETFRQLIETKRRMFVLYNALPNSGLSANDAINILEQGLKKLRYLQHLTSLRISKEQLTQVRVHNRTLKETLLPKAQEIYISAEGALTRLKAENDTLIENNKEEKVRLEKALKDAQATVTAIEKEAKPSVPDNPGNEPTIPPDPGGRPSKGIVGEIEDLKNRLTVGEEGYLLNNFYCSIVEIHGAQRGPYRGRTWIEGDRTPARQRKYLGIARERAHEKGRWYFDKYHVETSNAYIDYDAYLVWPAKKEAYDTAVKVYTDWQGRKQAYDNACATLTTYNNRLQNARNALTHAQQALTNHQTTATQAEANKKAEIDVAQIRWVAARNLRLCLIGAELLIAQLIFMRHRRYAVHMYNSVVNHLDLYSNGWQELKDFLQNAKVILSTIESEGSTIEELMTQGNANDANDALWRLEAENDRKEQLETLKRRASSLQAVRVNDIALENTEFFALSLRLSRCQEMDDLVLSNVQCNTERLQELLTSPMPKLQKLVLTNNQLEDTAALHLLAYLYQHRALLEIKLDKNKDISSWLIQMIDLLCVLKYYKHNAADIDRQLYQFLLAQECLSLNATAEKGEKFVVSVKEGQFSIDCTSGKKIRYQESFDTLQRLRASYQTQALLAATHSLLLSESPNQNFFGQKGLSSANQLSPPQHK